MDEQKIEVPIPDISKPENEHLKEDVEELLRTLADDVYEYLLNKVNLTLKSRKKEYLEALTGPQEQEENKYDITLDASAKWIEEGIPSGFDMVPGLLASSKAKTGTNGRYLVVPFNLSQKPNTATKAHLQNVLKKELRQRHIPFRKLETDADGRPKTGKLHGMDIEAPPRPDGKIMASTPDNISYLKGVGIFQTPNKKGKIERKATTFRTVTESHSGQKWIHPGLKGFNGLSDAAQYGKQRMEELLREFWEKHK